MERKELLSKYPWLEIERKMEDYVSPTYYDNLLKEYRFSGKDDLEIFRTFLFTLPQHSLTGLELGPGTGRVTGIALKHCTFSSLQLVDLSQEMLDYSSERFSTFESIQYVKSDSLEYLEKTSDKYDLIYSLWSFSHSVHQHVVAKGVDRAKVYVDKVLRTMCKDLLRSGGSFYLVHFDTTSDEQLILLKQWARKYPIFKDGSNYSRMFIEEIFDSLVNENVIELNAQHLIGDPIVYDSIESALEIFMNFHLESHFNNETYTEDVIQDLKDYFKKFEAADGKIYLKPACYEYIVKKH